MKKIIALFILMGLVQTLWATQAVPVTNQTANSNYLTGTPTVVVTPLVVYIYGAIPTATFTVTSTYTATAIYTPTKTYTPTATLPAGTNTYTPVNTATPTNTYTSTPTYTFTPTYTPTANATTQVFYYSADVLSPGQINLANNVRTIDFITQYAAPPTGAAAVTNFIYQEAPGQSVTTNGGVTQVIAHAVLSGENTLTGIANKSFYIKPQITPTQTAVATYIISIDKAN